MDIESKRYRIRSAETGGFYIECKVSGKCKFAAADRIPSADTLARIHESAFDRLMVRELG